jgi:hypothetical protein
MYVVNTHGAPTTSAISCAGLSCLSPFRTGPYGKTEEQNARAGEVAAYPAGDHLPENLSDGPLEVVLVELKR